MQILLVCVFQGVSLSQPAMPPEAMVKPLPVLPLRSHAQYSSMSISVTHITINDHADIPGLGYFLGPC